jgi:hypothetical protein
VEAHVNKSVPDHAKSNPSLHAFLPAVETAVQTMPPLENTNPTFATRAPSLAFFEGSFFLLASSLLAAGVSAGYRNIFYPHFLQSLFVGLRIEARVGCHDAWH